VVPVTVESPGVFPYNGTSSTTAFAYPHDEINFPASGAMKVVGDVTSAEYRTAGGRA